MDTLPPDEVPPEIPIVLPAADLPPLGEPEDSPMVLSPWPPADPPMDTRTFLFLTVLGVGAVIYVLLFIVGGPGRQFAADGLQVLPFVCLALLAYAGETKDEFRLLTLIFWVLLIGLALLVAIMITTAAEFDVSALPRMQEATRTGKSLPGGLPALFLPGGLAKIALTAIGCLFAALAGAWCLARSARRLAARALPAFDADSFVHAVALATVVAMTLMLFAPLAITGEPPLLAIIRNWSTADFGEKGGLAAQLSDQNLLVDQVYSFLWLVPMGIVVVGWPLHRTLPAALRRVGFVVPTLWQVLLGLWLAGFLAFLMAALVDPAIGWLWKWLHWPQTDEKAFEQLFKSMTSPVGAVVVAVTAGVGEELFARGILQPRLGILLSNLFFTAMHAPQYSWDALLSVFTVGLVLGVVRQKTNTSTSAIVHGTYDFLLVMAAYKQIDPSQWFGW